ncbi:ankyrin repeat domain-containing protein [Mucilaginibacter sp. OK098]|uniref:ankyrin repeat domain-containing protein n=1 Tax=Mucilaginibacter sp. OK098 TaxID=1855297 RepID=UPI000923D89E|nr:ankyrin repeat domain-containing protein [Mucilaginibacter sp. OK098]SHN27287.1 Ankyrin repeat-containing protein [Mucilaginibacter sp. OK098]
MQDNYPIHSNVLKADPEGVLLSIRTGANVDQLDDHGNSPLHWAVLRGDYDIVKILLEAGANPNIISTDGVTPKWSAIDFGLNDIEQLLTSYEGKVLTDHKFDRTSWSVFKDALGQSLPKEEE